MAPRITRLLDAVASVFADAAKWRRAAARSVLRLEDVIERSLAAEQGLAVVDVYEDHASLLRPRRIRRTADVKALKIIGVDSSSRGIEAPPADVVVAAVAAVGARGEVLVYPPNPLPLTGPPFIRVLPNAEGLMIPDDSPWIAVFNPAGERYGPGYSIHQALDEARVSLENWALKTIAGLLGNGSVILIDGSLYNVTVGYVKGLGIHGDVWRSLVRDRISAVKSLEDAGIPVIGVAKRVEKSRLISVSDSARERLRYCGLEPPGEAGDGAIIQAALASCYRHINGSVAVSIKLLVRQGDAEYIAEYLIVPPGRFQWVSSHLRVYRLEYSVETLELLRDWGLEPVDVVVADSLLRGSLQPVTIAASDWRARNVTSGLRAYLSRRMRASGVPLSYSSLMEERVERVGEKA